MKQLGVTVVGVGDVAVRDYLPEWHRLADRARLVCAVSRSEERATKVAQSFGFERAATRLEEGLTDDVDVVVNLTPARSHEAVTLAALAAGKHVYSEKPVATTREGVDAIEAAAARSGVSIAAAPSIPLFPALRWLTGVIREGLLGDPVAVHARADGGVPPWEGYETDPSHFFAADSGPWRDMGIYPVTAVIAVFGGVRSVQAMARRTVDAFTITSGPMAGRLVPVESPDDWHVTLETTGGVLVDIHANFAVRESCSPEFEVLGRAGTAAVSLLDVAAPARLLRSDAVAWQQVELPHVRSQGPDHLLGVEDLVEHICTGRPITIDLRSAAHAIDVLLAAEESVVGGRRIDVPHPA